MATDDVYRARAAHRADLHGQCLNVARRAARSGHDHAAGQRRMATNHVVGGMDAHAAGACSALLWLVFLRVLPFLNEKIC